MPHAPSPLHPFTYISALIYIYSNQCTDRVAIYIIKSMYTRAAAHSLCRKCTLGFFIQNIIHAVFSFFNFIIHTVFSFFYYSYSFLFVLLFEMGKAIFADTYCVCSALYSRAQPQCLPVIVIFLALWYTRCKCDESG